MTNVELSEEDAALFIRFCKYREPFKELMSLGVFESKNLIDAVQQLVNARFLELKDAKLDLDIDSQGMVGNITLHKGYRRR